MDDYDLRSKLSFIVVFAIFLLVPSCDTVLKYFGLPGVLAYFFLGTLGVIVVLRYLVPPLYNGISDKTSDRIAIVFFLVLAAFALYIGPIANSGRFGSGSDADDALLIAVNELANGRYPYYVSTYLGNRIGPMPGSILFATPFALTGLIQLQNVFWLAAFYIAVRAFETGGKSAIILLGMFVLFSPTVLQNIATGADYVSNTIFVMIFMWLLIRAVARNGSEFDVIGIIAAALLGIALSSRSTFFLVMPLLVSVLLQNAGWRITIKYLSISALVFLLITVPFWIYDPEGFAPLHVQGAKLTELETILPYARIVLPLSAGVLSVALSFQRMTPDAVKFFLNCAMVQLFILVFTAILYSVKLQRVDLYMQQSGYGMFTLFFGVTAMWMYLTHRNRERASTLSVASP